MKINFSPLFFIPIVFTIKINFQVPRTARMQLSVQNTTAIIGKYKNISGITGEITVHVPKTARVELSVKNVTSITRKENNITEVTGEITVHCDEQACRSGTGNFL